MQMLQYNVYINHNGKLSLVMENVSLVTAQLKVESEKEWYKTLEKPCPEYVIIQV